jgi:hypothetical protein
VIFVGAMIAGVALYRVVTRERDQKIGAFSSTE